jgi:hypothetical protein
MKTAIVLVCLLAAASAAFAQEEPRVTVQIRDATLTEAVNQISEATGVPILTDGQIARSQIRANLTDAPMDAALNALCAARELGWKRLYVKRDPEKKLRGEDLGNLLRALDQLGGMGMVAVDGTTQAATGYMREPKATTELLAPYAAPDSGYQLVYLIVDLRPKPKPKETETQPAAGAGQQTAVDRLISQEQQGYALMQQLTPDQLDQYWARQAEMFRSMDRRMQVGYLTMGMRMFLGADPEQARQMFFEAISNLTPEEMDALRRLGGQPGGPPPGGF